MLEVNVALRAKKLTSWTSTHLHSVKDGLFDRCAVSAGKTVGGKELRDSSLNEHVEIAASGEGRLQIRSSTRRAATGGVDRVHRVSCKYR